MDTYFLRRVIALGLAAIALSAQAQDAVIGYVKTIEPSAQVVTGGVVEVASVGMALKLGQVLKTGRPGSLGITLKDNTSMSIGPDSELRLDDYLFAPAKDELKLGVRLAKGSMYFISGAIAKLKPEAVTIKTPTGVIGVRGTQFLVKAVPVPEVKP